MEDTGRGWPLRRFAMRKANIHDEGAMSLAGAIRRAGEAVARYERERDAERRQYARRASVNWDHRSRAAAG